MMDSKENNVRTAFAAVVVIITGRRLIQIKFIQYPINCSCMSASAIFIVGKHKQNRSPSLSATALALTVAPIVKYTFAFD